LGLNVVVPISKLKLEVFLDAAPSLGLDFFFWDKGYVDRNGSQDALGFGFNVSGEFGVRVWF
jgi:hypothetical protein